MKNQLTLPDYFFLEGSLHFDINTKEEIATELKNKNHINKCHVNIENISANLIRGNFFYSIKDEENIKLLKKIIELNMNELKLSLLIFNLIFERYLNDIKINKIEINAMPSSTEDKWIVPKKKLNIELKKILRNEINLNKKRNLNDSNFSFFELPCVRSLLVLGGSPGQRNYGARIIAFACRSENIPKKLAIEVGHYYFERTKINSNRNDFNFEEILNWINWVYNIDEINWTCRAPQSIGVCNKLFCKKIKNFYQNDKSFS